MFGGHHMDYSNTQPEHRDLVDWPAQAIPLCVLLYHYRFELAHYWYVLHHFFCLPFSMTEFSLLKCSDYHSEDMAHEQEERTVYHTRFSESIK